MSINKKSNDATEKKGMALSDDALENVTGGWWTLTYSREGRTRYCSFSDKTQAEEWAEQHKDQNVSPIYWTKDRRSSLNSLYFC